MSKSKKVTLESKEDDNDWTETGIQMMDNTEEDNYIDLTNSMGMVELTNDEPQLLHVVDERPTTSGDGGHNQQISTIDESQLVHIKNETNDYSNQHI